MFDKVLILAIATFSLVGCSGSVEPAVPTTATGVFKDATTSGLSYVSGSRSGVTAADGSFTYEVGKTVTFTIGALTVGTAVGSPVVTPVDLVTSGDSDNIAVLHIVRVLNLLDSDGNSTNGITISSTMRAEADSWTPVDLSTVTTTQSLTDLKNLADVVPLETHTEIGEAAAQSHLEGTLSCAYAGAYTGTWSGDGRSDTGYFGFLVDATNNNVVGSSVITSAEGISSIAMASLSKAQKTWQLSGATPLSFGQNPSFANDDATGPEASSQFFTNHQVAFSGTYSSVNSVSGTYRLSGAGSGTGIFTGSRVGGSSSAIYRVTGAYSGNDTGLFALDIDVSNNVTGKGASTSTGLSYDISGTYEPGSNILSGTTSGGGSFSAEYDPETTSLITSGTWAEDSSESGAGTVTGSGCKLN